MCNFWSAIVSRTGKVYHLGDVKPHERIIEHFKLKDSPMQEICRIEITVLNDDFSFKNRKEWAFRIDENEAPAWWQKEMENACFVELESWLKKSNFKRKLNVLLHDKFLFELKRKSGEQIIFREKLWPSYEKLIVKYYLLGEKTSWDSIRVSVWDSVWDSVWALVWDSVWASIRDSVWDSVRASVRASVWDSVRASIRDSVWDSVKKEKYPLALPKKIFDLGYIHCLVTEKDGVARIHVYGKKGILLKKIDYKKDEKILVKAASEKKEPKQKYVFD